MQEQIEFTKMQGLGNDFMVIDAINQSFELSANLIKKWSDRHFGIGFDQLLLVEKSEQVDFKYRIFNADGSEVEQCGNGARCFAKFVYDKGLTDKKEILVETQSSVITLNLVETNLVAVDMGLPNFNPSSLPFSVEKEQEKYALTYAGEVFEIGAVSMGNPHAVLSVADVNSARVNEIGSGIESHKFFPERVNVGFVEKASFNHLKLRVFERGAGETLACGTGACAAMVVFRRWSEVGNKVKVSLPGGDLLIEWDGELDSSVMMTGTATTVFEGRIPI